MSTKKRFALEEIRHLRANPYAVHDRGRDLLHARLQGGVLGLEPARVHWTGRLPQAGLQYGSFGL